MDKFLKLHIIKPGMYSTIQDAGRFGLQRFGVPVGGFLDVISARQANQLVGNPPDSPLLEITLIGPHIRFSHSVQVAIAGADLSPTVNGKLLVSYQTESIEAGAVLKFGKPRTGCRAYLAVAGEWDMPNWLGSASFAGHNLESRLQAGQEISIRIQPNVESLEIPLPDRVNCVSDLIVPVSTGPEFHQFSSLEIARFFSQTFTIGPDSNRMGCRLLGHPVQWEQERELISSGIVPGTVQITPAGQAILLLADAQTVGGYPRLVQVGREALSQVAQLKPGDSIRFSMIEGADLDIP